ncbi:hypothetical protein IV203_032659 [Nitzschia inconspicua]|uniref:Uncharacterized protein n=1 Tax=Nitzschia inconspicua TaxID=303405 RepID=A0A9K3KK19_9STRA|nr:hypothetical protein IV203_032659 [Nitzschia inconspicua]
MGQDLRPRAHGQDSGTDINGELAARFERVCGHKGYSYDAYQLNKRNAKWKQDNPDKNFTDFSLPDMTTKMVAKHNRGRIHADVQREIGFEDCDYVSDEVSFRFWKSLVDSLPNDPPFQLELHVPCRDPVDWLMSMCNHQSKKYNCSPDITVEHAVQECLMEMNRFLNIPLRNNMHLKCFNPIPTEPYIHYMGRLLQPRRFTHAYVHKDTNKMRNKTEECIHGSMTLKGEVERYLIENIDIFRFCHKCMGSENDLFFVEKRNVNR